MGQRMWRLQILNYKRFMSILNQKLSCNSIQKEPEMSPMPCIVCFYRSLVLNTQHVHFVLHMQLTLCDTKECCLEHSLLLCWCGVLNGAEHFLALGRLILGGGGVRADLFPAPTPAPWQPEACLIPKKNKEIWIRNEQSEEFLGVEWASMRNTAMFFIDRLFIFLNYWFSCWFKFHKRKTIRWGLAWN